MAHLIRTVSGTNRDPIYGLWHLCELCPPDPEIPLEAEHLQKVLDSVEQVPGMTLNELFEAYLGNLLEREIRREA